MARLAATSVWGSARWCRRLPMLEGSAAVMASPAGLSVRYPWAMAQRMTAPMRWRTRLAVSGRVCQIGSRQAITSAVW